MPEMMMVEVGPMMMVPVAVMPMVPVAMVMTAMAAATDDLDHRLAVHGRL